MKFSARTVGQPQVTTDQRSGHVLLRVDALVRIESGWLAGARTPTNRARLTPAQARRVAARLVVAADSVERAGGGKPCG